MLFGRSIVIGNTVEGVWKIYIVFLIEFGIFTKITIFFQNENLVNVSY